MKMNQSIHQSKKNQPSFEVFEHNLLGIQCVLIAVKMIPKQRGDDEEGKERRFRFAAAWRLSAIVLLFGNCTIPFAAGAFVVDVPHHRHPEISTEYSQRVRACPVTRLQQLQQLSSSEPEAPSSVLTRLDLDEQFNRWRLLQQILEGEADASDVNEVCYRVLRSFLDCPRPRRVVDGDGISRSNTSPVIDEEKRRIIESLLDIADADVSVSTCTKNDIIDEANAPNAMQAKEPHIPLFVGFDCTPHERDALEGVEKLLPDPIDDEDAHKTCWDLVMEMYGKEAVKAEEMDRSEEWRTRSAVVRMLIHFDFLESGVL